MCNMTYRELREYLNTLDDNDLDLSVSIYISKDDEVFPVRTACRNTEGVMVEELDTLDPGHPLLVLAD